MNRRRTTTRRPTPPYGPTSGMLQGLTLLQKANITRVDEDVLREHGVAPGNEYKVIGALRFLGLLDEQGRPTERSRQLRTRGATFSHALQALIAQAYGRLFAALDLRDATKDEVYNYFVTQEGLGMEMAQKATRFLVGLCQLADMELSPALEASSRGRPSALARGGSQRPTRRASATAPRAPTRRRDADRGEPPPSGSLRPAEETAPAPPAREPWHMAATGCGGGVPVILALTPQTADLSEDDLARLFRKMLAAYRRAQHEVG